MIGILFVDSKKGVARKFFQFFKTYREFCREGAIYQIVISNLSDALAVDANFVIFYYSLPSPFDDQKGLFIESLISGHYLCRESTNFPINGRLTSIRGDRQGYLNQILRRLIEFLKQILSLLKERKPIRNETALK